MIYLVKKREAWNKGKKCLSISIAKIGKKNGMFGKRSHLWKGGKHIDNHGYIHIWKPDHPQSDKHGYILEHRTVMERYLKRRLLKNEVVHHINKNVSDNRLNNLILFVNQSAHIKFHKYERIKRERLEDIF
jgi:hypothetical protein